MGRGRRWRCVLDADTLRLLYRLWKKGWHVLLWKPDDPDCWIEMTTEYEERGKEVN